MDSLVIKYLLPSMSDEDYGQARYPGKFRIDIDQDGSKDNVTPVTPKMWIFKSPLTGEGFTIIPIRDSMHDNPLRISGYEVSINPPACIVGHNMLLENRVYGGCKVTLQLLKYWLARNGCSRSGIDSLSVDNATIESVTPTYFSQHSNNHDAHTAKAEFYRHAAGLYNKPSQAKPPVFSVGAGDNYTIYCKHHDFEVSVYLKDGVVPGASNRFRSHEIEMEIRKESACNLRIGVEFHKSWLKKHGKDKPSAWKLHDPINPHDIGIDVLYGYLRLGNKMRTRRPKPDQIKMLPMKYQTYLLGHLSGKDIRKHPDVIGKSPGVYQSIRKWFMNKLRINISLPWNVQSQELSHRLDLLINKSCQYNPPEHFKGHVYCVTTLKEASAKLDSLIEQALLYAEGG